MLSSINGSGKSQSLKDRAISAKYTVSGDNLARIVFKATTEEIKAPKAKHLEYLVGSTNDPNISIPQLANQLIKRTHHKKWVVVFKALITFHQIAIKGNERFLQYNSTNGVQFALLNFSDNTNKLAYDMSLPIRDYSNYLNEKVIAYRTLSYDLTRIPRGKDNGILRNMQADKLLQVLPVASNLMDALLKSQFKSNLVFNGVINSASRLVYYDTLRLFVSYNDGVIRMLELYFDMDKINCKKSLEIYQKFLQISEQMSFVSKNAADIGLDTKDIPNLTKAPASIYQSLADHLETLEKNPNLGIKNKKITGQVQPIIASKTSTAGDKRLEASENQETYSNISEVLKKKLIDEEEEYWKHLKVTKNADLLDSDKTVPSQPAEKASIKPTPAKTVDELLSIEAQPKPKHYNPFLNSDEYSNSLDFHEIYDPFTNNLGNRSGYNNTNVANFGSYIQKNIQPNGLGTSEDIFDIPTSNIPGNTAWNTDDRLGFPQNQFSPAKLTQLQPASQTNQSISPLIGNEANYFRSLSHQDDWNNMERNNFEASNVNMKTPTVQKVPAVYPVPVPGHTVQPINNSSADPIDPFNLPFGFDESNNSSRDGSSSAGKTKSVKLISDDIDQSLAALGGMLVLDHEDKMKKYESQWNKKSLDGRTLSRESVVWPSNDAINNKPSGLSTSAWNLSSQQMQFSLQKSNSILLL